MPVHHFILPSSLRLLIANFARYCVSLVTLHNYRYKFACYTVNLKRSFNGGLVLVIYSIQYIAVTYRLIAMSLFIV